MIPAVQIFRCQWWAMNDVYVRPSDGAVPEGVWFISGSEPREDEGECEGSGVNILLGVAEVELLHGLLGDWIASRKWPVAPRIHGDSTRGTE